MSCMREALTDHADYDTLFDVAEHPGLWFYCFLGQQVIEGETQQPYEAHVRAVDDMGEPPLYAPFFDRW